jgi:hypothetical protein
MPLARQKMHECKPNVTVSREESLLTGQSDACYVTAPYTSSGGCKLVRRKQAERHVTLRRDHDAKNVKSIRGEEFN